jgi:hypothetical protein
MGLHQIIYTSHSLASLSREALAALLEDSRRRNQLVGISGLLLHADGSFMQTIEGGSEAVQALFAKIKRDPRHSGIIAICDDPIERRSFAEWSMGFREIPGSEAAAIPGFARFATTRDLQATENDRDVARQIMQAFAANLGLDRPR